MFTTPRKQIRLPPDEYLGTALSFVTICCQDRLPIFSESTRSMAAIEALRCEAQSRQFLVHAFCLMPDHIHFLAEGAAPNSDLLRFVAQFKRRTGYILRNDVTNDLWQRRFYDHILRTSDPRESVAWYIWMNPVRKGIVADPSEYPFSGSFTRKWPEAVTAQAWNPPWKASSEIRV